jgi:quinolinate synthase
MGKENPGKTFHAISNALVCPNMKKTTLASVVRTMEHRDNVITVPEDVRRGALLALLRMLEVG